MTAILSLGNENSCCQPRQIATTREREGATMADGGLRWYGVRQRRRRRRWDQEKRRRSIERGCCARSGMKNPAEQTYCGLRNSSSSSSSSFKAPSLEICPAARYYGITRERSKTWHNKNTYNLVHKTRWFTIKISIENRILERSQNNDL